MIQVDENQYTGVGKIYAVGDVAGGFLLLPVSVEFGLRFCRWQLGHHWSSTSGEGGAKNVWKWTIHSAGGGKFQFLKLFFFIKHLRVSSNIHGFHSKKIVVMCEDKAVKPYTVWTIPEISWAGINQQEADAQGLKYGVVQVD